MEKEGSLALKPSCVKASRDSVDPGMLETSRRARATRSLLAPLLALCAALAVLLSSAVAGAADARTSFLVQRLQYPPVDGVADDFRIRTNAALALGASDNEEVVTPLCQALSDPSEIVRQAVAAALKRLNKSSATGCISSRLDIESNAAVKLQLTRALQALQSSAPASGGGSSGNAANYVPKNVPNAKFYVALANVTNNTKRPTQDIENVVLAAMRDKLEELGSYQVAPMKETPEAAKAKMKQRKMKGFYLSCSVDHEYTPAGRAASLRVKVKCAVFTYPGRDLRGEVPASLSTDGVSQGDKSTEDNLTQMAAGHVVDLFAQNASVF